MLPVQKHHAILSSFAIVWSGNQEGSASPSPSPGPRTPCHPTHSPPTELDLHVENRLLVPVLPSIPDRQGVITPLQVKLLKGQLDHLGRGTGLVWVGLGGRPDPLVTPSCPDWPFPGHLSECASASPPPCLCSWHIWPILGTAQQSQAHLAACKLIRHLLHALMNKSPRGLCGNFCGHMWNNLSFLASRDLQKFLTASLSPAQCCPFCLFIC